MGKYTISTLTLKVVERMGKFHRILPPGLAILIPFLDAITYVKSLKEIAVEIPSQRAITQGTHKRMLIALDNVQIDLDGVLYYRIVDPFKASYGVQNSEYAIAQIAQTTMVCSVCNLSRLAR